MCVPVMANVLVRGQDTNFKVILHPINIYTVLYIKTYIVCCLVTKNLLL